MKAIIEFLRRLFRGKTPEIAQWECVGVCNGKPLYRHDQSGEFLSWHPDGHWEMSEVTHTSKTD